MGQESELSRIRMQIMWNRLIAVVEEQAQTLIRTSFSTTVREAGDLSAGVFDLEGRMLAQAVTGTPGHINAMAESVGHFLEVYPVEVMSEGDHYITNDPWKGTGHLYDLTVVSPTFRDGKPVALFANTAHVIDVGGRGFGIDARQVYEEGLFIPVMPVVRDGELNETFFEFIRWNSRTPVELEGDVYSLCACNDVGSRRLVEMMEEFALETIDELARYVLETSREVTLEKIRKLPQGTYRNTIATDGYEHPIEINAAVTIGDTGIDVDYAGTSPMSGYGINVPIAYTRAYTCFGLKVAIAPDIPNNAGSLLPFRIHAPDDCILNAQRPWPTMGRHIIGHFLPDAMFGCLRQVLPGELPAESASCLWNIQLRGGPSAVGADAPGAEHLITEDFDNLTFNSPGIGARAQKDGLNGTAFPSGVRTMPVEATENVAPLVFWRKEYRPDSGGPGYHRGGTGQIMWIGAENDSPFVVLAMFDRCDHPAGGRDGGKAGRGGGVGLVKSGTRLRPKGRQVIPPGDWLALDLPGGGGLGDPLTREPGRVAEDVRNGMVSMAAAKRDYGVVVDADGVIDTEATAGLRAAAAAE
jgi:N-methylhydantoinase B